MAYKTNGSRKRCRCGAVWRINYPFGRNSKARINFETEHADDCRHKERRHSGNPRIL